MRPNPQRIPAPAPNVATSPLRGARLRLRANDVDVWRANLDDQRAEVVELMQARLSPDEAQRARRFYFERDRLRFIVARGILRTLLSRYVGGAPEQLVFSYGPNGKPALAPGGGTETVYFNVAHSDHLALFAFTRAGEVGIDVERIRELPEWEQVAEAAFSAPELAQLRSCPPERRREEFFRAWTRQEAVLKALGTGLSGVGQPAAPARADAPGSSGTGAHFTSEAAFKVYPLHPAPGFAAALAAAPAGQWTTFQTWMHNDRLGPPHAQRRSERLRLEQITTSGAPLS
jgi:4'-phosphopantetheinyl transferase